MVHLLSHHNVFFDMPTLKLDVAICSMFICNSLCISNVWEKYGSLQIKRKFVLISMIYHYSEKLGFTKSLSDNIALGICSYR